MLKLSLEKEFPLITSCKFESRQRVPVVIATVSCGDRNRILKVTGGSTTRI